MKYLATFFVIVALFASSLLLPLPHTPLQAQSEQEQITALLALITQLQQQLALLLGQGTCTTLTQNLYIGLYDYQTGNQVSKLQTFLKAQGDFTHPTITGFFGVATQQAVQKFQARMGIVGGGTPATTGYGVVGPATRAKIQAVSCGTPAGAVAALPAQQLPPPPPEQPVQLPGNITASCNPSISAITEGQSVTWSATVSGGSSYTYVWSGTNGLSGSGPTISKTYNSPGTKTAQVKINGTNVNCASAVTVLGAEELLEEEEEEEETQLTQYACSDGIDNDGDGLIDYPYEIGCSSATDNNEANDIVLGITQYFHSSTWAENEAEDLGAEGEHIIYGLDLNKDNVVDASEYTKLKNKINSQIPNVNDTGFGIIDEEGPMFNNLKKDVNDPLFIQAQEQMVAAIEFAQDLRPKIKWGYYAYPNFPYWIGDNGVTKSWKNASAAAKEAALVKVFKAEDLIDAVQVFAPSLYPHYIGDNENGADTYYANLVVVESLERNEGKKPVVPFYTHRYYNGTASYTQKLVPWAEFQNELSAIVNAGAHGIFWWGADWYFWSNAIAAENPTGGQQLVLNNFPLDFPDWVNDENYGSFFALLQIQYLKLISEVMFGYEYDPQPITYGGPGMNDGGFALNDPGGEFGGDYLALLDGASFIPGEISVETQSENQAPAPKSFLARLMNQMASVFNAILGLFW